MSARDVLMAMVRTDRGDMTVWTPEQVRRALAAYRAEVLRWAADVIGPECEEYGVIGVDSRLRRLATEAESGEDR